MTVREEFREFASDYLKLADRADTPELRERFLEMAREWTEAANEEGWRSSV